MNPEASHELGVNEQRHRYFDQSPDDYEEHHMSRDETPPMDNATEGYISIKDYAYDESNPLHYGYFQDKDRDMMTDEDGMAQGDSDSDISSVNGHDKRQSIVLPKDYLINQLAVALYDFEPENDNELGLKEGDVVYISYRHGQGWLVAENQERTKTGLVPEEFVTYLEGSEEADNGYYEDEDGAETARPFYLTHFITEGINAHAGSQQHSDEGEEKDKYRNASHGDSDGWEDIDNLKEEIAGKLNISKN